MRRRLFLATHETRSLHSTHGGQGGGGTHRVRVTSPTPGSASSSRTAQQGSRAVARPCANKRENKVKGPLAEQSRHHRALSVSNRAKHVRPPPTALGRVPSMSRPPHRHACPAVPRKKEPHRRAQVSSAPNHPACCQLAGLWARVHQ